MHICIHCPPQNTHNIFTISRILFWSFSKVLKPIASKLDMAEWLKPKKKKRYAPQPSNRKVKGLFLAHVKPCDAGALS